MIVENTYELLRRIGSGGTSEVWLAMDRRLGKTWAIKVLVDGGLAAGWALAEAELLKSLDHPAFPRVVDICREKGRIYIVMDYIQGDSLEMILRQKGPQPEEVVLDWARQVLDALWYLHERKPSIIYRDIKPANLILRPEGMIKIVDFGTAGQEKELREDGQWLGTPGYASPEHYGKGQIDARSDFYCLGMTMYALLTGADPSRSDFRYHPVRCWRPELTGGIERIIDRCRAPDPSARYQTDAELMYVLEHAEQEDEGYRFREKKKLMLIFGMLSLSFLLFLGACFGFYCRRADRDYRYQQLLTEAGSALPEAARIQACLSAMEIDEEQPLAYQKLLEILGEDGRLTVEESRLLSESMSRGAASLRDCPETGEVCWKAACDYLYLYQGEDASFRSRLLQAEPYLQHLLEAELASEERCGVASALVQLAAFYREYVCDSAAVTEADRSEYEKLLDNLELMLRSSADYDQGDAAWIKLTCYREILKLLGDLRPAMMSQGTYGSRIADLAAEIEQLAMDLPAARSTSLMIRQEIVDICRKLRENCGED